MSKKKAANITPIYLPTTGLIRFKIFEPFIPFSRGTFHEGCKTGRFPKPIKLGRRTTVWRAEDIHALIQELGLDQEGAES